jgi:hypothetical protein
MSELKQQIIIWKRFAEAAHMEKDWMHTRLSWLFTPNGVLLTALVLSLQKDRIPKEYYDLVELLQKVIALSGFAISLIVLMGVAAACIMHFRWTSRCNQLSDIINSQVEQVPFGLKPRFPARSSSVLPFLLALVFVAAWSWIIVQGNALLPQ